jgi:carboxypeptidase family protein
MALRAWLARHLAAACVLAVASIASAQITTGTLTGTVRDGQGGVIPGATVILTSDTQGTKSTPIVTDANGDFVFVNLRADTYTIEVSMPSFSTLKRSGLQVSPGERVSTGALVIEVGRTSEVVDVKAEAPMVQSSSAERSFTIATDAVTNLPIAGRAFTQLAALAPGVTGTSRIGDRSSTGGGDTNIQMDGVSTMDTGSNRAIIDLNVESISEVKVLVSSYQAEYGRSSGLQITAVTKSGTNRFRGSIYDVERNSDWNANSKTNILNDDPKTVLRQRDWGYSIGGPVGKPGGNNKLFFFYTQEFEPRTGGNDKVRYRLPTALERQGDFSRSTDNGGNLYPYIKNPAVAGTCTAANTAACFADGGVLGRIPAAQLYQTGLNILKMYPMPNIENPPAGQPYNFEITRPSESILSTQPAMRFDYQATQAFRVSFKYSGFSQREQVQNGSIPGWNDTRMVSPKVSLIATTANYSLTPTLFLEGTFGRSKAHQGGCFGVGGGGGPQFCNAFPVGQNADLNNIGLSGLPFIFPEAAVIDQRYFVYDLLNRSDSPIWDGTRVLLPPSFSFGNRISNNNPNYAPPNIGFPSQNVASSMDVSVSLTKVWGRHTIKTGFYNQYSNKQQVQGGAAGGPSLNFQHDAVGTNPCDTSFGFSNAAIGCFSSYSQGSKGVEGEYIYYNTEGYVQDNWRVNSHLTLDYGIRLVHQTPQYDARGQASNFFVEQWNRSAAPVLYVAGCANGVSPCTGTNRQAMNPLTGQFLGPNSTLAIGTIVPNSGTITNGLVQAGQGIPLSTYLQPALGVAPRFGAAYDLTGRQQIILRGGGGLYFDRPSGNAVFGQVLNPPARKSVTLRFGQLQTLGSGGLATEAPSSLSVYEYDSPLPSSWQWNAGAQMALPWSTVVDVSYVGQHGFNIVEGISLNAVDFGTAFLAENQDRTLTPTTPGATSLSTDQMRAFRGYSGITQNVSRGWITHHSLQLSFSRRFRNGLSFGFNDTIGLSSKGSVAARLQHNPDGTVSYRADQAQADELLQTPPIRHTMKGNFVWDLPDLRASGSALRAIAQVINDWQLAGVWTASTGAPYTVGFNYQTPSGSANVNITGSPDYGGRIRILGDPGDGCSDDLHRQFNTAAFAGPLVGSVGLESSASYFRGCFARVFDLSIARNIRLPGGRNIQLRADMFNAFNEARITGRNTTLQLNTPADAVTNVQPAFDPVTGLLNNGVNLTSTGAVSANRSQPKNAAFGVANGFQAPRSIQLQIRFAF